MRDELLSRGIRAVRKIEQRDERKARRLVEWLAREVRRIRKTDS